MTLNIVKGEPLRLPDGTLVLPEADTSGSKVVSAHEQREREALQTVETELADILETPLTNEHTDVFKRTLADVQVPFKQMNLYMLVASYSMWGLDSFAIGNLLNISPGDVDRLKDTLKFGELQQQLVEAVRYAETASIHGYLSAQAHSAVRVVSATLKSASGDLRLAAAKDILDRSGFRPADRVEHVHKFEDEMRIVYVQDDAIPTHDVEIDDGNGS